MQQIRPFKLDDAPSIAAIYRPIVNTSAISFEVHPPDTSEIERRYQAYQKTHPWLVLENGGCITGYAYAAPFKPRAAYDKTAEVSIYLSETNRGQGRGAALLCALMADLKQRGFTQAIATIVLPNPGSINLFIRFGFEERGILTRVGYKFERWHDIGLYQRSV